MMIDMAFMDEHEKFLADRLHSDNRSVGLNQRLFSQASVLTTLDHVSRIEQSLAYTRQYGQRVRSHQMMLIVWL